MDEPINPEPTNTEENNAEETLVELKKPEILLKKITELLPLFTAVVIVLGLIKNIVYFDRYLIPIKYYMTISELPILIAGDLFLLIPFMLYLLFMIYASATVHKNLNPKLIELEVKKPKIKKLLDGIGILVILFVIASLFYHFFSASTYAEIMVHLSSVILLIIGVLYLVFADRLKPYLTKGGDKIILIACIILFLFTKDIASEIEGVDNGKYKGTKIVTKDSTYISTDTAYFIGQTSNYIFFYNKKDKHSSIIPTSEVIKLELYSK